MKVKKVKRYKKPVYPMKIIYELQPELLGYPVPCGWLKNYAAIGTLLAFIASGVRVSMATDQADQPVKSSAAGIEKKEKEEANEKTEVKIAPIFIHGEGTGATGCIVVAPPAFMSEAEAIELILDELKKENIVFDKNDITFSNLTIQETRDTRFDELFKDYKEQNKEEESLAEQPEIELPSHPIVFDGYNSKYNLGFKFIGSENYYESGGANLEGSSVQHYDFISTAYALKERIKSYNQLHAAIFYDPTIIWAEKKSPGTCHTAIECKQHAAELLMAQVHDFIEWFKTEIASKK